MNFNYITVYSKSAETQLEVMDDIIIQTGAKVVATNNSALFNDEHHQDVTMHSVTYQTEYFIGAFEAIISASRLEHAAYVKQEEDWYC